jgi:hypothetical protein
MGIMMTAGGPIDEYLRATGKTKEMFDAAVIRGDPATTSIFAAEVICKEISALTVDVESIFDTISSRKE